MKVLVNVKNSIKYVVEVPEIIKVNDHIVIEVDLIKTIGNVIGVTETQMGQKASFISLCVEDDYKKAEKAVIQQEKAMIDAKKIANKFKLDMEVLKATYDLDGNQLLIEFYSENRVDFRSLAKELAFIYKTRIELRQVGVRDKAKIIGGYGPCGQRLCCQTHLSKFDSVSIKMAKNQSISLNPNKINGACGRLLCCLRYENEMYSKCRECLPKKGSKIKTEKGEGIVSDIDVLKKKYKVYVPKVGLMEFNCGEN